ncbi:MAG: class I SAM-dependent methyltransferase [Alphaproteobacteria bacterium]|nr:class I SAM-dependent methyltransferase [Alphaproteobacteria bacterium]OJV45490.1 MAG: hypothetical protein BGO28_05190 [Alphaproteobacteria bacterium 43-37]
MLPHLMSKANAIQTVPPNNGMRIPTLNKMGDMLLYLDEITTAFIDQSDPARGPILDVGCAYGYISSLCLEKELTVTALDIEPRHIAVLEEQTLNHHKKRLTTVVNRFPDHTPFEDNTFQHILVARVFNFMDDHQTAAAAKKLYQWLKPGGKVFVTVESPYLKYWLNFVQYFEARKKAGVEAPGLLTDPHHIAPTRSPYFPDMLNFHDPDTLSQFFIDAGFKIETCHFISRPEFPEALRHDGRESVGLIAVKPDLMR